MKFKKYYVETSFGKTELHFVKTQEEAVKYIKSAYPNCGQRTLYVMEFELLGEQTVLVDTNATNSGRN